MTEFYVIPIGLVNEFSAFTDPCFKDKRCIFYEVFTDFSSWCDACRANFRSLEQLLDWLARDVGLFGSSAERRRDKVIKSVEKLEFFLSWSNRQISSIKASIGSSHNNIMLSWLYKSWPHEPVRIVYIRNTSYIWPINYNCILGKRKFPLHIFHKILSCKLYLCAFNKIFKNCGWLWQIWQSCLVQHPLHGFLSKTCLEPGPFLDDFILDVCAFQAIFVKRLHPWVTPIDRCTSQNGSFSVCFGRENPLFQVKVTTFSHRNLLHLFAHFSLVKEKHYVAPFLADKAFLLAGDLPSLRIIWNLIDQVTVLFTW